nr:hypothetical protein CFP56_21076 [Quercus suber]
MSPNTARYTQQDPVMLSTKHELAPEMCVEQLERIECLLSAFYNALSIVYVSRDGIWSPNLAYIAHLTIVHRLIGILPKSGDLARGEEKCVGTGCVRRRTDLVRSSTSLRRCKTMPCSRTAI